MIGTELREAREAARLSVHDVAARSGGRPSAGHLSLIENGRRYPTLRTLETLARVLGVTVVVGPRGARVTRRRTR